MQRTDCVFVLCASKFIETMRKTRSRNKNTSTNQYKMYLDLMERDPVFAAANKTDGHSSDSRVLGKWKQLSAQLNTCTSGPKLTPKEWRKRLSDWKDMTRCKYRHNMSGAKTKKLNEFEIKGLELFGILRDSLEYVDDDFEEIYNENISELIAEENSKCSNNDETPTRVVQTEQFNTQTPEDDIKKARKTAKSIEPQSEHDVPSGSANVRYVGERDPAEATIYDLLSSGLNLQGEGEIVHEIKRIADMKFETLRFEIAKQKFESENFDFNVRTQL